MIWAQVIALAISVAVPASPYAWPLDLPRIVTSSFAEYRFGRFHAGVDLHTGGIGKPVHAPSAGRVARVSCSPWGYGKALYLQLSDGNTVVFGHLDGFAPAIRDYVHKAQHERESYTVDLKPDPSLFPVKQGDVVAFSGDTGTGVAHLHYEIRDAAERPTNLRLLGIDWPDQDRPIIRKVLVVPAAGSTVNGDLVPAVFPVRATASGEYVCAPVHAAGSIGIGIDVIDPANAGANKLGVYRVRTLMGGKEVFRIQMDRFSYDRRNDETVSYYPFEIPKESALFLLQWRWAGNVCDIFQQPKSDGWLDIPPHPSEVRVEVEDFLGNKTALTIPIQPESRPVGTARAGSRTGKGKVEVACVGTWLVVTACFDAPEGQTPELHVVGGDLPGGDFRRINESTFRAAVTPTADAQELVLRVRHERIPAFEQRIHVFHRGAAEQTITEDGVSITVKPESPYGTLYLRLLSSDGVSASPLAMRGKPIRLWPSAMPVDEPITVTFPGIQGAVDLRKLGVYRDAGSYWTLEGMLSSADSPTISTRRLGVLAILEDDKPPAVSDIVVGNQKTVATKRPTISAAVSDPGSGIGDTRVTCNGRWLLFAYDPERGRMTWEQDEDLPEGPKELVFTATDKAGNATRVARTIEPKAVTPAKPKAAVPKAPSAKSPATKSEPPSTSRPKKKAAR
jgi:murein DD-endopeptidase MepM/ murein hydrolase activator NlpD